jgi:Xaa-Pro aminopeptidase
LDQVARRVIVAAGYGENFVHQTGHGVGLEIHERPFLGRKDGILRSQMLVTVEPGIYLPGRGGVRIEDTILISETGHENLTTANRALLEL